MNDIELAPYKVRMLEEMATLDTRIGKLEIMLKKNSGPEAEFVFSCPVALLEAQLNAMKVYSYILHTRKDIEIGEDTEC